MFFVNMNGLKHTPEEIEKLLYNKKDYKNSINIKRVKEYFILLDETDEDLKETKHTNKKQNKNHIFTDYIFCV